MKNSNFALCLLLLALCFSPLAARAQNEWVLQPFVERTGTAALQELGKNVAGFMGSFSNNPFNVAVSQVGQTGLYKIRTPNDANTPTIYWGESVIHGDFNGDRYTDYVIWKNLKFSPIDTVIIYWGTATGIDTLSPLKILSEEQYSNFGESKCAGDINGDGIDDLVVGAHNFGVRQGKIYIYLGGKNFSRTPSHVIIGDNRALLGTRCSTGDLNGDGYNDLVIRGYNSSNQLSGYLNIYFGGARFDTTKDLVSLPSPNGGTHDGLTILDINGDSRPDLVWARHDTVLRDDKIYLHWGGRDFSQRFQRGPDFIIPNPDSQRVFGVVSFGVDIANAGDMNGDGGNDIVVGTRSSRSGTSYVFVFSGGKALDAAFDAAKGQALDSDFGRSVAGLGDVNGDGLSDIMVGAPQWKFGTREGYWGIFLGDRRITTSVKVKSSPPAIFRLSQNYPNPFKAGTRLEFSLPEAGWVQVRVFDLIGAQVRSLVNAYHLAGTYAVTWNGHDEQKRACASGVYLVKLSVWAEKGGEIRTVTQKMILAR